VRASDLIELFGAAADAERDALAPLTPDDRRARTDRPGQYALDLVADAAILEILHRAPVAVVSEESGRSGVPDADVTVVVDPVDGSTNCAREIPYWGISLCALDANGAWCALVTNTATGERFTAVRGEGARSGERRLHASATTRIRDAVVGVAGLPSQAAPWKQYRSLGSAALALCDVAAGRVDAFLDVLDDQHYPWDYLGGMLIGREAGASVVDVHGRDLVITDPEARRQLLAAATPELLDELRAYA
jgi:fructose-1,6-bisphosphatase/inositol monophosphatase family enzyme